MGRACCESTRRMGPEQPAARSNPRCWSTRPSRRGRRQRFPTLPAGIQPRATARSTRAILASRAPSNTTRCAARHVARARRASTALRASDASQAKSLSRARPIVRLARATRTRRTASNAGTIARAPRASSGGAGLSVPSAQKGRAQTAIARSVNAARRAGFLPTARAATALRQP